MQAPRQPLRLLRQLARGVLIGLSLWSISAGESSACRTGPVIRAQALDLPIVSACGPRFGTECKEAQVSWLWYDRETKRYPHGVLGDDIEYAELEIVTTLGSSTSCDTQTIFLDDDHVFEDIAPRPHDLDGDGLPEIVTIRSHQRQGAQLAVYGFGPDDRLILIATTPYIGTRFRWLAPAAIGDLDGDGHTEIAYIDRPHLAKILRIWRFKDGKLSHVADQDGLTNHRIGEDFISGGLRSCNGKHEILTANANWTRIMATTFDGRATQTRDLGSYSKDKLAQALTCQRP